MDTRCIYHGHSLGITVQGTPKEIWGPTIGCFPYTLCFPASVLLSSLLFTWNDLPSACPHHLHLQRPTPILPFP